MHAFFTMMEPMKITLLIALTLINFNSFAQDDCTLNPEAIKSVLKGAKVEKQKHSLKEWMKLKDFKVTYETGGCAHYAFSFTYEDFGKVSLNDKKSAVDHALKFLNATPVSNADNRDRMIRVLKEALASKNKLEDKRLSLPCGDANCELDLSETGKLRVGYDFAL